MGTNDTCENRLSFSDKRKNKSEEVSTIWLQNSLFRERGMVTVELALALVSLTVFTGLLLSMCASAWTQMRVNDAAALAARAAGRDTPETEIKKLVAKEAGEDATYQIKYIGPWVEVKVQKPSYSLWNSLVTASSSALRESSSR